MSGRSLMPIYAPPTLLNTIIHKKHLSHFMAKSMNELAHKSPLIVCAISSQNVCQKWTFATGYLLSGEQYKIQKSFGVNFHLKSFFRNHLRIVTRSVILVDRSGGDEDMIYLTQLNRFFPPFNWRTSKCINIWDTGCKSRHSSFLARKCKWKPFKRDKLTSRDFVAHLAALWPKQRPNIFYPEIHEVDLWQV